nr:MAG TPA: hypothetical protein [Bacteriophage sp.]
MSDTRTHATSHNAQARRGGRPLRLHDNYYALRKTVLSSARTARLNGLRDFRPLISRPRYLRDRKSLLGRS